MEIVAGVAGIVAVLTSWLVAARLLWLWRSTRRAPELLIGLGLLLLGGLWNPLIAVGRQVATLPDATRAGLVLSGALCAVAGMLCLALFTWRVFRPSSAWAGAAAAAVGIALLAAFALQSVGIGWVRYAYEERGPWLAATWIGAANYLWGCVEVWRQQGLLARRERLGLVDPVVADRVRLWGFTLLTSLVVSSAFGVFQWLGVPVGGTLLGLCLSAVSAALSSGCLWLAFLPPARYVERVRTRAASAAA